MLERARDRITNHETVVLDGVVKHIDNPNYLDIDLPTVPCKYCSKASWNDLFGIMVYCCDMSNCCIHDEDM